MDETINVVQLNQYAFIVNDRLVVISIDGQELLSDEKLTMADWAELHKFIRLIS